MNMLSPTLARFWPRQLYLLQVIVTEGWLVWADNKQAHCGELLQIGQLLTAVGQLQEQLEHNLNSYFSHATATASAPINEYFNWTIFWHFSIVTNTYSSIDTNMSNVAQMEYGILKQQQSREQMTRDHDWTTIWYNATEPCSLWNYFFNWNHHESSHIILTG